MTNLLLLLNLLAIASIWDRIQLAEGRIQRLGDWAEKQEKSTRVLAEASNVMAYAEIIRLRGMGITPESIQGGSASVPASTPQPGAR